MSAEQGADALEIEVGFATEQGRRERNEDYCGVYLGNPAQRARSGIVAALADGVGGESGGRVAAELSVRSFIDFYLGQPELAGIKQASSRSLQAINQWLNSLGRLDPALLNLSSTFTGLILRGRHAHILQVGDSRAYRLRDGALIQLTEDHTLTGAGRSHILTRAMGAVPQLRIDYRLEDLRALDRLLLCSDGVHGVLSDRRILEELSDRTAPEDSARRLIRAALDAHSGDNITALIVDVLNVPAANLLDLRAETQGWPILPAPAAGAVVDGFRLETLLADGRYARVFRGVDQQDQRQVVLKFPKPIVSQDQILRQAFLRENWIASRVRSPWVGESVELPAERRSCLYTVLPYYAGETLEQRLTRNPPLSITKGLAIAKNICRAVGALHRAGIIHRDIKPENIILETEGGLKLIDLGVARLPNLEDDAIASAPGTPSFMAPELLNGVAADELSDQFALGVTIYRLFTQSYPYGEIEPFSRPSFTRPASLAAKRPDLPSWLDHILARSYAADRAARFDSVLSLLFELEHGAARAGPPRQKKLPLYHRNPLLFWQSLSITLLIALAAMTIALVKRRG